MKQLTILLLILIAAKDKIYAQGQPQYICDTSKPKVDTVGSFWMPFDAAANLTQSIYYKNDFPTMPPQGFITDIFIKVSLPTPAGSSLPGLTVKLGITSMNDYPAGNLSPAQFKSLDSTLTTVFYDSFYVLPAAVPANSWWKLALPQPFQYSILPLPGDVPQNLIVQLSKSVYSSNLTWKFNIYDVVYADFNKKRCIRASKNNPPGQITMQGLGNFVQLIGFNGYALSVDDPQKKVPFSVYPNPATDKLHVSKEASGVYEVYDLRGLKVAAGNIKEGEEVNVQNLSPGMYVLRMGEKTTRFVKE